MWAVKSPADQPCAEQPRGRFQGEAHVFFKLCHYWLKVSFGRFLASSNSVSSIFSCIHLSWEGSWDHSCLLKELDSMGTSAMGASARLPSHLIFFLRSVHFFFCFFTMLSKEKRCQRDENPGMCLIVWNEQNQADKLQGWIFNGPEGVMPWCKSAAQRFWILNL